MGIMDRNMMIRLDRQMLLDFYSLGAWVHQYTATALYHEAQRIPADAEIAGGDKPRIQAALRAKILAEAVASMETLGRFCFAVEHRIQNGFAAAYVNQSHNVANEFYQDILNLGSINVNPDTLLTKLELPSLQQLQHLPLEDDVNEFLTLLSDLLGRIAERYIDDDPNPTARRKLTQAYNAIKHGSHVVGNPPVLTAPFHGTFEQQAITIIRQWPIRDQDITSDSLIFVQRSLSQEAVMEDLQIITDIAKALSNLCQMLIVLLDQNLLTYN